VKVPNLFKRDGSGAWTTSWKVGAPFGTDLKGLIIWGAIPRGDQVDCRTPEKKKQSHFTAKEATKRMSQSRGENETCEIARSSTKGNAENSRKMNPLLADRYVLEDGGLT